MKVDFALHAALRGLRPRAAILGGLRPRAAILRGLRPRAAILRGLRPRAAILRGLRPRVATPGDVGPRLAAPGGTGLRGAAPARSRFVFTVRRGSAAAWPARRAAARIATARWWRDRSASERRLLTAFLALVVAAGVARLVWAPLIAERRAAETETRRDDRIAAELRVAGPEVARIAAARRGSLATVVTAAAARAGLTVARLEPQGADVAVGLDGVGFDALIDWLAGLDRDAGVVAVELKVERRPDPGLVTAQVTLAER